MKANRIIKQNIEALLKARGLPRRDLAQWCYRSDSWLSKILREERREFAAKDLDRIADFFGLAAYQLFQPGLAVERRKSVDRRSGRERRVGPANRLMLGLGSMLNPLRHAHTSELADALLAATADHERKVAAIFAEAESRRQAAAARPTVPAPSRRRRAVRGSDPPEG